MRIEQLEYVAAVTRTGSLRRASEQLHVSQPALSEAVSKLERELGVEVLDRRRSGARMSRQGRELLPLMTDVLEAVERLRLAAGDRRTTSRLVRLGTVNTATTTLLAPALRAFQELHPQAGVEIVDIFPEEIRIGLEEGSLDLGLVNLLEGDDAPATVASHTLVTGRPVVVLPGGHPLVDRARIGVDELRAERFVMMRAGYLMNRFAHRLFGDDLPPTRHATDGAEMGKLLVAQGLGLCLLPDFSVVGDPLERAGLIVARPLADADSPAVRMVLLGRRADSVPDQVRSLAQELARKAAAYRPAAQSSG